MIEKISQQPMISFCTCGSWHILRLIVKPIVSSCYRKGYQWSQPMISFCTSALWHILRLTVKPTVSSCYRIWSAKHMVV